MRRSVALLSVMGLVMTLLVVPAGATTTRMAISGTGQVVAQLDPGRQWQSGAIEHVRDRVFQVVQMPDQPADLSTGFGESRVNYNLDTTTLDGRAWGSFEIAYDDGGFDGSFRGDIHVDPTAPGGLVGQFHVVARGWGSLDGVQLRATSVEFLVIGQQTFEGVMFTPGA